MTTWYMAHPVGGDTANVARAERWLRWLWRAHRHVAVIAPWLHEIALMGLADHDPDRRQAALVRCEAIAAQCTAVVLVGGEITAGMRREACAGRRAYEDVIDLTHLGPEPPKVTT